MTNALWVGLGGLCGALLRYGLGLAVRAWHGGPFPLATLGVNVLGCLAIGWVLGREAAQPSLGEGGRLFLVVGLLGAFTTFSTFGWETVELLRAGRGGLALTSVGLSLLLGLGAVALGLRLGS